MQEFISIFKKVNGIKILKQYAKSHVLLSALAVTAIEGFSKKSLELVRLSIEYKDLKKLRKKYKKFISEYKKNDLTKEGENPAIIWVCWFQGMENAPDIVKLCFESLHKIKGYEIRLITADNYKDYISVPEFIIDKYKKGIIEKAHFADLIRLELLIKYGGTWIDSTVLCTSAEIPEEILESELFVYRILKPGLDGHAASISNWFITACQNNKILQLTLALLYRYWEQYDFAIDYYIFHLFFELALEAYPEKANKIPPYSSETPHILLLRLFDNYEPQIYTSIIRQSCFHKLSYKFCEEDIKKENTFYRYIMKGDKIGAKSFCDHTDI